MELNLLSLDLKSLSNTLRKSSAILILSVVLISATFTYQMPPSYAASEFNSNFQGLIIPKIEIQPTSGPPGTEITITVSDFPSTPKSTDPRTEFFVTLPFFGFTGNVPSKCDGEYCLAIYTFDELKTGGYLASKEITFTLFSEYNSQPFTVNRNLVSDCDVKINDKVIQSFSYLCNGRDVPSGFYEINFGWGIQMSDKYDWTKTLTFTVTEPSPQETETQHIEDVLFTQYEKNLITEKQFIQKLKERAWTDLAIQKALASLEKWTDTDMAGVYSGSRVIDLTPVEVNVQKMGLEEVQKEHVDDRQNTKTSGELVMADENLPSQTSSDSSQDLVLGMIIASVVLVVGLMIAFVKKGII